MLFQLICFRPKEKAVFLPRRKLSHIVKGQIDRVNIGLSQLNKAKSPTILEKETVPEMEQSFGLIDERDHIWFN